MPSKLFLTNADTVIIGSGISGALIADNLLIRDHGEGKKRLVILEARTVASGATGRNGGHIKPDCIRGFADYEQMWDTETARKQCEFERANQEKLSAFIKDQGLADVAELVDYRAADCCMTKATWAKEFAPYQSFSKHGLFLYSNTPALEITPSSKPKWKIKTSKGYIVCDRIIHATNGYATFLMPELSEKLVPLQGHAVATDPSSDYSETPLSHSYAFHWGEDFHYLIQRPSDGKPLIYGDCLHWKHQHSDTAKQIMRTASVNLKNVTLETGGKSPILIFDDADLEQATKWAHIGIMANQGQVCTATSRILVQKGPLYDKFIAQFKKGAQVSQAQHDRVLNLIQSGKDQGAKVAHGGSAHTCQKTGGKGYFIEHAVFTNVEPWMDIYREEIFGPVAVVVLFETEEDAVELANNHIYGLGSAIFTRDVERAHRVAEQIESGMVWINSSQDSDVTVPFGGVKQSCIGRELGEAALEAYTQVRAVHLNMGLKL
ncbi:hypothetical protein PV08_05992 [Exophiala spinifera]|uniref:Aldehyde dehydrogenase domain-containing protein n=1 Tax=Exophiala spinifera TaxID=91928 RepID=A0A0D1ZT25_9EURO|nr:uncharacterized protein PV08_05992 [Exophiala spinifera]KIW15942.1 hypothetical protein PV08_05992 [Exophiala spinifera]